MDSRRRGAVVTVLVAAATGAALAWLIRGQIGRYRRDLFSPRAFKRLAALGHIAKEPPSIDLVRLLRDFIAWEPRPMLRARAETILGRMLDEATTPGTPAVRSLSGAGSA